ncbi:MAG: hypothetical protein HY000_07030 [Planctomycetes bacterium]|nr:hypothetical protein [Planctomycetota bacterium]
MQEKGASALTDEELVAAILGMGTAGLDHPSGDPQPSEADIRLQARLTEAANPGAPGLGLRVLDHIIVTRKGHYSFQEVGLIS